MIAKPSICDTLNGNDLHNMVNQFFPDVFEYDSSTNPVERHCDISVCKSAESAADTKPLLSAIHQKYGLRLNIEVEHYFSTGVTCMQTFHNSDIFMTMHTMPGESCVLNIVFCCNPKFSEEEVKTALDLEVKKAVTEMRRFFKVEASCITTKFY